jgi:hypothetical protein
MADAEIKRWGQGGFANLDECAARLEAGLLGAAGNYVAADLTSPRHRVTHGSQKGKVKAVAQTLGERQRAECSWKR